jgi:hypothetical protein
MNHYGISIVEYETFGDYEPTKLVLDKLPDSFLDQNADELVETPLWRDDECQETTERNDPQVKNNKILPQPTTALPKDLRHCSYYFTSR